METDKQPWAVVLAAGSGNRLSSLTVDQRGTAVPKQFCSLSDERTLLEDTLARAARITGVTRTTAIVAAQHSQWWQPQLASLPPHNVVAQPLNRGTAVGILLMALHIHQRDPNASLVFLPSDHFIRDEAAISACLLRGLRHLHEEPDALLLLGITPEEPDSELGYIVPRDPLGEGVFTVREFIEKPSRASAEALLAAGAVWNSFIFTVRAATLLDLFAQHHAPLVARLRLALTRDAWRTYGGASLAAVYGTLDDADFSRDLLAGNERTLRLLPAPRCGWTDLGTPARVGRCVQQLGMRQTARSTQSNARPAHFLNLANAYSRLGVAV